MELINSLNYQKIFKYLVLAVVGSIILTISAKIKIPFYPVPMTMQTFVVLLLGITLGPILGSFSVVLYLIQGVYGLPVFSNSPEKGIGIAYFVGPTMGYLIGFVFACYVSGIFKYNNNYIVTFIKLILSVSIIYILGLLWLGNLIGWEKPIFSLGAKPFLLAEFSKIMLLTLLIKYALKFRKFIAGIF